MISIFTPTHNPRHLDEIYKSIIANTYQDRERIVLLNNGAKYENKDKRVKISTYEGENSTYVGKLKSECCKRCSGDIYLELDHDDELTPDCLEEIAKAFEDKEVVFVYGNSVNVNVKGDSVSARTWSNLYGWEFRPFMYKGVEVQEAVSAGPYPQSISRIWYAPNHPRAFRATTYKQIGGYNESMVISDDHDIIQRMYLAGKMVHINKPLYIYRVTGDNTWLKYMNEIQTTMREVHDKYFIQMMEKRSKENGLELIDLGGAINKKQGYKSIDRHNADIVCDLNKKWKLKDNSVGVLRAYDIIEHLPSHIHTMNEAYRVLAHGGILDIQVPAFDGMGSVCDPTHCSFWNKRSFRYYTEPNIREYIEPECKCRFTVIKPPYEVILWDNIKEIRVQLMAWKDGYRFYGENFWR